MSLQSVQWQNALVHADRQTMATLVDALGNLCERALKGAQQFYMIFM